MHKEIFHGKRIKTKSFISLTAKQSVNAQLVMKAYSEKIEELARNFCGVVPFFLQSRFLWGKVFFFKKREKKSSCFTRSDKDVRTIWKKLTVGTIIEKVENIYQFLIVLERKISHHSLGRKREKKDKQENSSWIFFVRVTAGSQHCQIL